MDAESLESKRMMVGVRVTGFVPESGPLPYIHSTGNPVVFRPVVAASIRYVGN